MQAHELLNKMGYNPLGNNLQSYIAEWEEWYSGKVKKFHNYTVYNGKKRLKKNRATLSMAKKVCEDWANLLLNEKVEITTDSESATNILHTVLENNNFRVKANQLVEIAFAFGTGAFVEYVNAGNVKIDYIRASMIYPLSVDNGNITECAFCSEKIYSGKHYIYIQAHVLENGLYVVKNRFFEADTSIEVPLPDGLEYDYYTKSKIPLFQIITPNIVNNIDIDNPMGISVFSDAIDILKGIDLVYDSYCNEFRLGKKRIMVPVSMAKMRMADTGVSSPIFDDNDTEFYAMQGMEKDELKEINMNIRSAEHKEGLQEQLNLLSANCGLGTNRYSFENSGVKTATEVISEQSAMFQNLRKHMLIIKHAVSDLCKSILFLSNINTDINIEVDFDDSIIHDTSTEFTQNMQLVSSGVMPKWEFRMWWFNESENQAKEKISEEFNGADEE